MKKNSVELNIPEFKNKFSGQKDVSKTDLRETPVQIGMPVEMVTRKIREDGNERGMLVYGYKFRPVLAGPR